MTGRRFDRMSIARKSMIQLRGSGPSNKLKAAPSPSSSATTPQNEEDEIEVLLDEETTAVVVNEITGEVETVRRRSRTRKPRGRRRNTLAGTDQREIEEAAANGFVCASLWMSFATPLVIVVVFLFRVFGGVHERGQTDSRFYPIMDLDDWLVMGRLNEHAFQP